MYKELGFNFEYSYKSYEEEQHWLDTRNEREREDLQMERFQ